MKRFLKKWSIVAICGLLPILSGCESFSLKQEEVILEYGELFPTNFDDIIETDGEIEDLEYSSDDIKDFNDILPVGEYTVDLKLGSHSEELKVIVKDTTKPLLSLKEDIKILENQKVDYLKYVNILELSEYTSSIDDSNVDYNKPGQYEAQVVVKDQYDNEASLTVPLLIEEVKLKPSFTSLELDQKGTKTLSIDTNSTNIVSFQSSNPSIATVDDQGNIKALKAGTVTISASVDGKTTNCQVKVKEPQKPKETKKSITQKSTTKNKTTKSTTSNKPTTSSKKDVGTTVYITNTGGKYHTGGCRYLRKSKIKTTKNSAIAQGLTPCKVCRP